MSVSVRSSDFLAETRTHFGFLRDIGFVGPEEGDYSAFYGADTFGIGVYYDQRDGRVLTIVSSSALDRDVRASLECLYVTAKLGPAQDIRDLARSYTMLSKVLESQATALRKVLPILEGAEAFDLLLKCHGR